MRRMGQAKHNLWQQPHPWLWHGPILNFRITRRKERFVPCCKGLPSQHGTNLSFLLVDRKSTRLNSSHTVISYAVFCLKKKKYKYSVRRSQCHISRELI